MNTKQAALDAVNGLYCKRACGMAPGVGQSTYTGTMDLVAFVESCPVPQSSDLEEHRRCWDEMRRRFADAWLSHMQGAVA